jgi:DNA-binding CsgD family transcriptional regulator
VAVNKELPADLWKFIESVEKHGAAVVLYDEHDNVIFANSEYRAIYRWADFSVPQTYDSVTWKVVEIGLLDDHIFLSDPHDWLRGAHEFRRSHRLAQYIVHHNTNRTYLAHHQKIDGFGTIAARFDCTKKLISGEMRQNFCNPSFDLFNLNSLEINFSRKIEVPSAVVSVTGKLIDASRDFLNIIERDDGISLISERISIYSKFYDEQFYKILRKVCNTSEKSGGDIIKIPKRDEKKFYIISVGPLRFSTSSVKADLRGASLVSLMDPDFKPIINLDVIRKIFNFTAAEARVAISIAHGNELAEIAKIHNVSIGTIRNQLKVIFLKTGVSRQAELVRLICNINQMGQEITM